MADVIQAYCVRCKAKSDMKDPKEEVMHGKRGSRRVMKGLCVKCGTKMVRILGNA